MPSRYGYQSSYQNQAEDEAYAIGRDYMEGKISIGDVERYLNKSSYLSHSEKVKRVAKGAKYAEEEGKAVSRRVQPEQEPMHFGPRRRNPGAGGKLADRPEHTKWKPPVKQAGAGRGKRTYSARPKALNEYDVKAQRKKDLKMLLDKHARGQTGVKEVKRESRTAAQGKAYKNVVYNETKHKYVGPNRTGAPAKKEWDYQPKRSRKKKADDKYLFTYSQGGARNQQVSISAPTKEQAKKKFATAHPTASHVDIRLVMRGD